jgi:hypothetical protein
LVNRLDRSLIEGLDAFQDLAGAALATASRTATIRFQIAS